MVRSIAKRGLAALLIAVLCMSTLAVAPLSAQQPGSGTLVQKAYAEDMEALEQRVKQSASAYNEAVQRQEELENEIDELDGKIDELEKQLPKQRERCNESLRALYKYQADTSSVIMMLLSSSSITDMLSMLDQYNWIIEYNTDEIEKTAQMESDLKNSRSKLESDKASVDQAANDALASLEEAKAAREAAKQAALAAQEAERKAARQEAASASTPEEKEEAEKKEESSSQSSASDVDWSSSKSAFVNKWAPRINSHLSGSPTAGLGKVYAAAAWDNGVDPRWAPAISCIESGKGAHCFRTYNAWGYGGRNFSSWEEGINTVVASLGGPLYGGYLTHAAAETYCPSDPDSWYRNVAAQMARI